MRKLCACLMILCMALMNIAFGEEAGMETAQEAICHMGLGWNLGNSLDATDTRLATTLGGIRSFETTWGNPVTPDTLMMKLKTLGFGAVRIPITWRYHFDSAGNVDEAWLNRVAELVEQALAADLYCIINMHHDTGSDGWLRAEADNFEKNGARFAQIWRCIAERFRDYPDRLLFEGFNEMLDAQSEWNSPSAASIAVINQWNQLFVDTVRATGGNNGSRNLICCTYAASNNDAVLRGFTMPEDSVPEHLAAEVHFYSPYEFVTSEGITWTEPLTAYTSHVQNTIDRTFRSISKRLNGIPWIVGEFAADDKGNTADRIQWYVRVIEDAKAYGSPCFIWDNGKGFNMGLIDRVGEDDPFPEIVEACVAAARKE